VRYDRLGYREVKQALQEFIFNINIPTRVGFQTPFTNITLDLNPPSILKDMPVVVGGVERPETYGEFQPEMDALNRAFAEVMMEGDAKGRVFTFPIPTYNLTADFDWDNPNLEPLWRMTGKYGIPYFSIHQLDMSPEMSFHVLPAAPDNRELLKRGGGLFGANPLTGSIGVVTLNLPRIGYLSDSETDFFARLGRQVRLAAESLTIKRKVLEQFTDKNLYPYSQFYLRDIKKSCGIYWKNHFSTIGIIGMNEACLNFRADTPPTRPTARPAGHGFPGCHRRSPEDAGTLFNLRHSGEGTSYRLAMLDQKRFPDIICANASDVRQRGAAPYYTNSSQLPVGFTDDLFQTLKLQDELQSKYTGGTVLHIFLGEQVKDTAVIRSLVRKIASRHRLPYFTLTPTFSICPTHGYLEGEQPCCSRCSESTEVYSRVVGYLRPVKQWNSGKQAEFADRKALRSHSPE
jgi:ribonucleoside-triphosphate reductase